MLTLTNLCSLNVIEITRMPVCSAPLCSHSQRTPIAGLTFHKFPLKKPELLKRWLRNVSRKDFVPNKSSRLCSKHFTEDSFEQTKYLEIPGFTPQKRKRKRLKEDAVPTIFKHQTAKHTKRRTHTEKRIAERDRKELVAKLLESSQSEKEAEKEEKIRWLPPKKAPSAGAVEEISVGPPFSFRSFTMQELYIPLKGRKTAEATATKTSLGLSELTFPVETLLSESAAPIKTQHTYEETRAQTQFTCGSVTPAAIHREHSYATKMLSLSLSAASASPSSSSSTPQSAPDAEYIVQKNSDDIDAETPAKHARSKVQEAIYTVNKSSLMELFKFCKICGNAITSQQTSSMGTMFTVKVECHAGHIYTWKSQPVQDEVPMGNLHIAAGILHYLQMPNALI